MKTSDGKKPIKVGTWGNNQGWGQGKFKKLKLEMGTLFLAPPFSCRHPTLIYIYIYIYKFIN